MDGRLASKNRPKKPAGTTTKPIKPSGPNYKASKHGKKHANPPGPKRSKSAQRSAYARGAPGPGVKHVARDMPPRTCLKIQNSSLDSIQSGKGNSQKD